jgi:hypothetical protein
VTFYFWQPLACSFSSEPSDILWDKLLSLRIFELSQAAFRESNATNPVAITKTFFCRLRWKKVCDRMMLQNAIPIFYLQLIQKKNSMQYSPSDKDI